MDYLDFDLTIQTANQAYRASVLKSPAGEASTSFTLPFDEKDLKIFLLSMVNERGVRRRGAQTSAADEAKKFGGNLFNAIFNGRVRDVLMRSTHEARNQKKGLRLRLRLTNVPELGDIPWEYLYSNRFLALSRKTPLVRFLEVDEPDEALKVEPPLKMLVMVSSPRGGDNERLDVDTEVSKLRQALGDLIGDKLFILDVLDEPTLPALVNRMRLEQYHVFHFIGHGGFEGAEGFLVFEDEFRRARRVSGEQLAEVFDINPPRLVVLNACEGARAGVTDPFAGTAQKLVQRCVPAVIAMQFEITDPAAITFAHEFYKAVAEGFPVDAALADARLMIWANGRGLEWGTPVLYMRSPDGRIFDIDPARRPPCSTRRATGPLVPLPASGGPRNASVRNAGAVEAARPQGVSRDSVQFTVYQPEVVRPGVWDRLLAFVHPTGRPAGSGEDEPEPLERVARLAREALGRGRDDFRPVTQDSSWPVPHESELSLIPHAAGVEFDPPRKGLVWQGGIRQEEFRVRAAAGADGQTARGTLSVYLGSILLADVPLEIRVDGKTRADQSPEHKKVVARPYRKIFASYSRKDAAIVEQFERYARALGDKYLRDITELNAGEVWEERLEQMIDEADVFQLFWSSNSMRSPFVRKEWEHALSLRRANFIRPTYWEQPLPGSREEDLLPTSLRALHFQLLQFKPGGDAPLPPAERPREGAASAGEVQAQPPRGVDGPPAAAVTADPAPAGQHSPAGQQHLEPPVGIVDHRSPFYIKRVEDQRALSAVSKRLVIIKAPGLMGRTSLLERFIDEAKDKGRTVIHINFQRDFDEETLTVSDRFYRNLCQIITYRLSRAGLPVADRVGEYWQLPQSNNGRCTDYVKDHVLDALRRPITLAMDDVDCFYNSSFRSGFYTMLRGWRNEKSSSIAEWLAVVLVTSSDPFELIALPGPFASPLNNYDALIELKDFSHGEVAELNRLHGSPLGPTDLQSLMELLSGHPFLVRRVLFKVAQGHATLDDIFDNATAENGPFGMHLRSLRFRLTEKEENAMREVLRGRACRDKQAELWLMALGLLRTQGAKVAPRCRLYENYFKERLDA